MLYRVEVVTLKCGVERKETKEIETRSTAQAIIEVLQEHPFTSVQSVHVDYVNDAVS
jgi:hypothetical protein